MQKSIDQQIHCFIGSYTQILFHSIKAYVQINVFSKIFLNLSQAF